LLSALHQEQWAALGRLWFAKNKLPRIVAYATSQYDKALIELSQCNDNARRRSLLSALEQYSVDARTARVQLAKVLEAVDAIAQYAVSRMRDPNIPPITRAARH
jgi:hypothetical protein